MSRPLPHWSSPLPHSVQAWGALRDWLWSSSHPFGGIPVGCNKGRAWLEQSSPPLPGLLRGRRARKVTAPRVGLRTHCSPATCCLAQGQLLGRNLPAANMNDLPHLPPPLPNPGDPGGLRASLPRIWASVCKKHLVCEHQLCRLSGL